MSWTNTCIMDEIEHVLHDILNSLTVSRLKVFMRQQDIKNTNRLTRKSEIVKMVHESMSVQQRQNILNAAGNFYWLRYTVFPIEVVSLIVTRIRREKQWWNALSRNSLENMMCVCVLFTPPTISRHGMKMMMQNMLPDFEEACHVERETKRILQLSRRKYCCKYTAWDLRSLRKRYIWKNVQRYGPRYLLFVPSYILIAEVFGCNTNTAFSPTTQCNVGWHDFVIQKYMEINFPGVYFDMRGL